MKYFALIQSFHMGTLTTNKNVPVVIAGQSYRKAVAKLKKWLKCEYTIVEETDQVFRIKIVQKDPECREQVYCSFKNEEVPIV